MKRSLNYVIKVSEYGSIHEAAEVLYITPSALSKFILTRERELGVDLFDRSGKKFILTYAGKKYVDWAKKIVSMLESMENEMTNIALEKVGIMHFGFQIMQAKFLLSQIIPVFNKNNPDIDIVVESTSYTLKDLLNQLEVGLIDFVITTHDQKNQEFEYRKIGEIEFVLIVPKGHPGTGKSENREGFKYPWINLGMFGEETFISQYEDQEPRRIMESVFEMYQISPHIRMQVPTSEMSVLSVVNGQGSTISYDLPAKLSEYADNVDLLSIGKTPIKRDLSIIYKKGYVPKAFEEAFFSICKDFFSKYL